MDEDEKLLQFLVLQYGRIGSHGEKIWEEIKHFSWALYTLLSAAIILKPNFDSNTKSLIVFPLLGIIVALFAIFSIYKEGKDFLDALGTALAIEKKLGFHDEINEKTPKFIVSNDRKKRLPADNNNDIIDRFVEKNLKISFSNRSLFILYFFVLLLIGIAEILWLYGLIRL